MVDFNEIAYEEQSAAIHEGIRKSEEILCFIKQKEPDIHTDNIIKEVLLQ